MRCFLPFLKFKTKGGMTNESDQKQIIGGAGSTETAMLFQFKTGRRNVDQPRKL